MGVEDLVIASGVTGGVIAIGLGLIEIMKRLLDRLPTMRSNGNGNGRRTSTSIGNVEHMRALVEESREQTQVLRVIHEALIKSNADHMVQLTLLEMAVKREKQ